MGNKNTHRVRNALSAAAIPASAGTLSSGHEGRAVDICPTCGGTAVAKEPNRSGGSASSGGQFDVAEADRVPQVETGAWWLERGAFRGLSPKSGVLYLGGLPDRPAPYLNRDKALVLTSRGLQLKGLARPLVDIPWEAVVASRVEDPRPANRPETLSVHPGKPKGPLALLVAATENADVLFLLPRTTPDSFAAALAPLVKRLNAGRRRSGTVVDDD